MQGTTKVFLQKLCWVESVKVYPSESFRVYGTYVYPGAYEPSEVVKERETYTAFQVHQNANLSLNASIWGKPYMECVWQQTTMADNF